MYYIYSIDHDMENYPLWVGMTDNPGRRFQQHMIINKRLVEKVKELREFYESHEGSINHPSLSLNPKQHIYAQTEDINEARELERQYINYLNPLLNIRDNEAGIELHKTKRIENDIYWLLRETFPELENTFEDRAWDFIFKVIDVVKGE